MSSPLFHFGQATSTDIGPRSRAEWAQFLRDHLPPGDAIDLEEGSLVYQITEGLAYALANVDALISQVLDELDPRRTSALLEDHERLYGLPRACQPLRETAQGRRETLVELFTRAPNLRPQTLIDAAAAWGFTVTIKEYFPETDAGDLPLSNRFRYDVTIVDGTEAEFTEFRAGQSQAGDPLGKNDQPDLACLLDEVHPGQATRGTIT